METASGEAALNEIRAELKSQGYLKYYSGDKKQKPADFLRFTSSDGFEILVGRNNAQNDKLTLHTARGKDPGSTSRRPRQPRGGHEPGEDIPDTTKQEGRAGGHPFQRLQGGDRRQGGSGHHRGEEYLKANGAKPGMVLYEVYTTVYITPREGLEEQLKKK